MAVSIHPILLSGNWDLGYSLDIHVKSSVYVCDDPYGNPTFVNDYSELGELLNGFKYHGKYENLEVIVDTVVCFFCRTSNCDDISSSCISPRSRFNDSAAVRNAPV